MVMRVLLVCAMFFQLSMTALVAQAGEQWVEGKNYKALPYPVRTRDTDKVEVVELFWYGCPHCYSFEPMVQQWQKKQAADVDFWMSPAIFGKTWKTHAQAFYTAELLGVSEQTHEPLFAAIVRDRRRLNNENSLAAFFADYGVKEEEFKKVFNSFAVNAKLQQADARGRSYRVTGVPAFVVNGKYLVSAGMANSQREILEIVDYLVNKERSVQ